MPGFLNSKNFILFEALAVRDAGCRVVEIRKTLIYFGVLANQDAGCRLLIFKVAPFLVSFSNFGMPDAGLFIFKVSSFFVSGSKSEFFVTQRAAENRSEGVLRTENAEMRIQFANSLVIERARRLS